MARRRWPGFRPGPPSRPGGARFDRREVLGAPEVRTRDDVRRHLRSDPPGCRPVAWDDGPMHVPRVVSLVPSATETLIAWDRTPIACTRFCEQPTLRHVGGTKNPDLAAIVEL